MARKKPTRQCNICDKTKKMSDDHVPPTCCKNKGNIKFYRLFEKNLVGNHFDKKEKPRIHQNGIYYTSICESCNNELGKEYDSYLGTFVDDIKRAIDEYEPNDNQILVKCKPNRVVRSIVGHFLAAFNEYTPDAADEIALRDYYKNEEADTIKGHYLYCWLYPFDKISVVRNTGIFGKTELHNSIVSIMKFYPLAFMLINRELDNNMTHLTGKISSKIDEEVNLSIDLRCLQNADGSLRNPDWPLHPNDDYVFVVSNNMYTHSVVTTSE